MHGIRMLDGNLLIGPTWNDVEQALIRAVEYENDGFRPYVAGIAADWSGLSIAIDGDSRDFLFECERAGLLLVVTDPTGCDRSNEPTESVAHTLYQTAKQARKERYAARTS